MLVLAPDAMRRLKSMEELAEDVSDASRGVDGVSLQSPGDFGLLADCGFGCGKWFLYKRTPDTCCLVIQVSLAWKKGSELI